MKRRQRRRGEEWASRLNSGSTGKTGPQFLRQYEDGKKGEKTARTKVITRHIRFERWQVLKKLVLPRGEGATVPVLRPRKRGSGSQYRIGRSRRNLPRLGGIRKSRIKERVQGLKEAEPNNNRHTLGRRRSRKRTEAGECLVHHPGSGKERCKNTTERAELPNGSKCR